MPVIDEEIKQVQAVFELMRLEATDNIVCSSQEYMEKIQEEERMIKEEQDCIVELRQDKKIYCIE